MVFLKSIQLGLIHGAIAITLVPINSTLNRIMIEDLGQRQWYHGKVGLVLDQ